MVESVGNVKAAERLWRVAGNWWRVTALSAPEAWDPDGAASLPWGRRRSQTAATDTIAGRTPEPRCGVDGMVCGFCGMGEGVLSLNFVSFKLEKSFQCSV